MMWPFLLGLSSFLLSIIVAKKVTFRQSRALGSELELHESVFSTGLVFTLGDDPSNNCSFTCNREISVPSIRFQEEAEILRHMGSSFNTTCSPSSFW